MKTHFTLRSLLAIASLGLLAVAFAVLVSTPFRSVAAHLAEWSWVCGALAIFLIDYAPRRPYGARFLDQAVATERRRVPAPRPAVSQPGPVPAAGRSFAGAAARSLATLGWSNPSATVSPS